MQRPRFARILVITSVALALASVGGDLAIAQPAPAQTHQCGHGLHPRQLPRGSGPNLHHCGHGLNRSTSHV